MFKKIFSAMLLAAMFFICGQNNFAQAKIDDSKISIGGIIPGDDKSSKIMQIYGEPQIKKSDDAYFAYGTPKKEVKFKFYKGSMGLSFPDGKEWLEYIILYANNGMSTPDGIKIGTTESELKQKYGAPDIVRDHTSDIFKDHTYYYIGALKFFIIKVKNGKVSEIIAGVKEDYHLKKSNPKLATLAELSGNNGVPTDLY